MSDLSELRNSTAYEPGPVEERWRSRWEEQGAFRGRGEGGEPFSIVIPPPNVTGVLHIGHALDNTIQDILTRFARMRGRDALWLPGTDHAGIATQVVVERHLAKEGLGKADLGREGFLERVWEWKGQSHGVITSQLRRLGCSLDWSRERFTLDEGLSRAVREAFCRLHEQGLIHRGRRIVNWCPNDRTALSDEEVEHEERAGKLWRIRYPLAGGEGAIEVATTRPETMLGDTGVAVNPDDERYASLVGKLVRLPLVGREIPIVADERVDLAFGTGAVKVTPAHDPLDFDIGQTHGLPQVVVIGLDGAMTEEAGVYASLCREECRERVLADLTEQGLLIATQPHTHSVGCCQRCGTLLEPLVSAQWFLRMAPLGQRAIEADAAGLGPVWRPERWRKVYLDWLAKLGDWCISRQIWWGHRIPVWRCASCGDERAWREEPRACPACGATELEQDPDVLDTWFSSGLWPFSTMGWPDDSAPDLARWFPTTVLVTGYDIIFFWVVRMATMSLAMTDRLPFGTVYIHGLVRDEQGRKISKSLGNTIDPIELMDRYGADALRFALASLATGGQDISFGDSRLTGARNFANKVWNASRFALLALEDWDAEAAEPIDHASLELPERWILSRCARAVAEVTAALEAMELADAADRIYHFWWSEFCDWYVEMAKAALYGSDLARRRTAQGVLREVLATGLRLLHPMMPHLTEELWSHLPGASGLASHAPWPEPASGALDPEADERMSSAQAIVRAIRNLRAERGIAPSAWARAALRAAEAAEGSRGDLAALLRQLARVESVTWLETEATKPERALTTVSEDGTEIHLLAEGLVDFARERARLEKELSSVSGRLEAARRKLADERFTGKAPEAVVAAERGREAELAETEARLRSALSELPEV